MKRCIFTVGLVVNENVKIDVGIQSNENANSLIEFSHFKTSDTLSQPAVRYPYVSITSDYQSVNCNV